MKSAALGIRMHSGWGVLVVVDEKAEVLDRRRIAVSDRNGPRGNQPYHHAQTLGLPAAEKFLTEYAAEACRMAAREIRKVVTDLSARQYKAAAAAVLLASGRKLPPLPKILAAHPLIHTAEGELFRDTVRRACEASGIPVLGVAERDLEAQARDTFGSSTRKIVDQLTSAGKSLGPPWNADHKRAALAGCMALHLQTKECAAKA